MAQKKPGPRGGHSFLRCFSSDRTAGYFEEEKTALGVSPDEQE